MEEKKIQRFIMMVGIPASGKSTLAKELIEDREDIAYLSSDNIREELFDNVNNQDNNVEVFNQMLIRTKDAFKSGKHVVYDATNISRKRRIGLLKQLPKNVKKIVIYFNTSINDVVKRNVKRDRVVPADVIERMYKNMQIPIYSEGWDDLITFYDDSTDGQKFEEKFSEMVRLGILLGREGYEIMDFLATYFNEFLKIHDMPHDSSYHNFSVSRHTYHVYKYILDNNMVEDDDDYNEILLWTALLHDVGKFYCKSFYNRKGEESKYANFIGHDLVGSQIASNILYRLGFSDDFIYQVTTLIQFHMYLLDDKANKDKLLKYVGQELYDKLEIIREADTNSH